MLSFLSQHRVGLHRPSFAIGSAILSALEIHKERQALRNLDAYLLDDIGLTPRDVELESGKSLWAAAVERKH